MSIKIKMSTAGEIFSFGFHLSSWLERDAHDRIRLRLAMCTTRRVNLFNFSISTRQNVFISYFGWCSSIGKRASRVSRTDGRIEKKKEGTKKKMVDAIEMETNRLKRFTGGETVDVGPFTIAHDLELRQFHFGENGDSLGTVDPFIPNLARREADCNQNIE